MKKITAALFACLVTGTVCAAGLPMVDPEEVGFSGERLGHITRFTRRFIEEGKQTGFVTIVARHGKVAHFEAVGQYGIDNDRPMEKDTLFRIYSMTKPVTNVAALMLYEEGAFQLNDPVYRYLPEFIEQKIWVDGELIDPDSPITIEQLMTHTAGFTNGYSGDHPVEQLYREADLGSSASNGDFVSRLAELPLRYQPGSRYHYGPATDVLGTLVERISGQNLEQFFRERIFAPLGMVDTFFAVPDDKRDRLASNHVWNHETEELALAPAASSPAESEHSRFAGGHGLISTAMDYMIFCEMLRNGGSYNGARILGPKTVQFMMMPQITETVLMNGADEYPAFHMYRGQSAAFGGAVVIDPGQNDVISSMGAYSWGGIANTKFWIDPEEDLVAILMTQLLVAPWSDATRFNMKVAVYQALTELGADN